jgi:hypothetical protein
VDSPGPAAALRVADAEAGAAGGGGQGDGLSSRSPGRFSKSAGPPQALKSAPAPGRRSCKHSFASGSAEQASRDVALAGTRGWASLGRSSGGAAARQAGASAFNNAHLVALASARQDEPTGRARERRARPARERGAAGEDDPGDAAKDGERRGVGLALADVSLMHDAERRAWVRRYAADSRAFSAAVARHLAAELARGAPHLA